MEKWHCDISSRSISLPILFGIFSWISRYIAGPYQTKHDSIFSKLWNGIFIMKRKEFGYDELFDMTQGVKFPSNWLSIIIPLHVNGKNKTQKRQRIPHLKIIIIHVMEGENSSLWWLRNNGFNRLTLVSEINYHFYFIGPTIKTGVNRCKSVLLFFSSHVIWIHCLKTFASSNLVWIQNFISPRYFTKTNCPGIKETVIMRRKDRFISFRKKTIHISA